MNTFLPADYEVPQEGGQYMKFEDGENRFRVLASPIVGWEDWDDERNVYRFPMTAKPQQSKSSKKGAKIKHFWAMPVWNYKHNRVQILNLTQSTIQKGIKALVEDADWGKPYGYDIVVTKTGESLDTEYQVTPKPHKEIDPKITEEYAKITIDLSKLFTGENPFAQS